MQQGRNLPAIPDEIPKSASGDLRQLPTLLPPRSDSPFPRYLPHRLGRHPRLPFHPDLLWASPALFCLRLTLPCCTHGGPERALRHAGLGAGSAALTHRTRWGGWRCGVRLGGEPPNARWSEHWVPPIPPRCARRRSDGLEERSTPIAPIPSATWTTTGGPQAPAKLLRRLAGAWDAMNGQFRNAGGSHFRDLFMTSQPVSNESARPLASCLDSAVFSQSNPCPPQRFACAVLTFGARFQRFRGWLFFLAPGRR